MSTAAVIVAAGRGTRAGGPAPKQWQPLGGQSVARRSLATFVRHPRIDRIVLVMHPDDIDIPGLVQDALGPLAGDKRVQVVAGGATRARSVRAGLEALAGKADKVLIHDVARPLTPPAVIDAVLDALATHEGAAPALPVTDALWQGTAGVVSGVQSRDGLFRAQTPQGFDLQRILDAHRTHEGDAADDVEVARAAGMAIAIVDGHEDNLKITTAQDFERANRILETALDIRSGNGYDVHRFGPGDHVTLCGVRLPHDRGLQGHSDADVGMHALTDAIYGALAKGDIGRHFPPGDPQWKGADSAIFLDHAATLARSMGYGLSNADITLVCETPKIGPHADEMAARLAQICAVAPDRISVKATTSERLGFTGRGEGIAALATALLVTT